MNATQVEARCRFRQAQADADDEPYTLSQVEAVQAAPEHILQVITFLGRYTEVLD